MAAGARPRVRADRREAPVGVEQGLWPERLEEDRAAGRPQDARDLAIGPIDVEVMQYRCAADEAEAPRREVERLRVHDRERRLFPASPPVARRLAAMPIATGEMSIPQTRAPRRASSHARPPGPQPYSRTLAPGTTAAACSSS